MTRKRTPREPYGHNRGAQLLRDLRERLRLTQRQIGAALTDRDGRPFVLTQAQIGQLEAGIRGPSLATVDAIERYAATHGVVINTAAWLDPPIGAAA